jgi:endonuclease/exonuclease/phosphatase family metal-dependent hydrolase
MPYFVSRPHFHFHETDVSGKGVKELKVLQFNALQNHIAENNNPNNILIGDFNSFWFDKVIWKISKSFTILNPKAKLNKATFPSNLPILRLDYCFVSSDIKNNFAVEYLKDEMLSDHIIIKINAK